MENVKRWYIFLTAAVSLNVVTWAVITLLRRLLVPGIGSQAEVFALQIAVIVIGLPLYLGHWRWAQRLAHKDTTERAATLRSIYLYAVLAGLLIPILTNLYTLLVDGLLGAALNPTLTSLVAIAILAALSIYHRRVLNDDEAALGAASNTLVPRLYRLAFSGGGLLVATNAAAGIIHWLLQQIGQTQVGAIYGGPGRGVEAEGIRLLLGTVVWVFFWRQSQARFTQSPEEQSAVTRKVYLYLMVFIGTLVSITQATLMFAGLLRRLLGLPPQGDIRTVLPPLIVALVVWAYHAWILRTWDAAAPARDSGGVRRLALYLVAGVGLAALLAGLAGNLSVLVNSLSDANRIVSILKEQFAWFTAAIVAGLPTWLLPWRQAQSEASPESRRSLARRIYLYLFLFAGVMTILGSLIAIVYELLLLAFGERSGLLLGRDISLAIGYALIAAASLAYHARVLRSDEHKARADKAARLTALNLLVLDGSDGALGAAIQAALKVEFDGLEPLALGLTDEARARLTSAPADADPADLIADSGLLIAPWSAVTGGGGIPAKLASAVAKSHAHKILLSLPDTGVDWAGLETRNKKEWVALAVQAVKQYLAGEEVAYKPPLGVAAYAWIGIGLLVLLGLIMSIIDSLSYRF